MFNDILIIVKLFIHVKKFCKVKGNKKFIEIKLIVQINIKNGKESRGKENNFGNSV